MLFNNISFIQKGLFVFASLNPCWAIIIEFHKNFNQENTEQGEHHFLFIQPLELSIWKSFHTFNLILVVCKWIFEDTIISVKFVIKNIIMWQSIGNYINLVTCGYILSHLGNGRHLSCTAMFHPLYDTRFFFIIPNFEVRGMMIYFFGQKSYVLYKAKENIEREKWNNEGSTYLSLTKCVNFPKRRV